MLKVWEREMREDRKNKNVTHKYAHVGSIASY